MEQIVHWKGSYYSFKTQVKALDNDEQDDPDFLFSSQMHLQLTFSMTFSIYRSIHIVSLSLQHIFTANLLPLTPQLELTIESLPMPSQMVVSSQETWRRKRTEGECCALSKSHFVAHVFFAAMVKPSRRRPSYSGLIPHILLWKCIEFQLAQGQSINVPLFTLFQVVSGKQTAK